jgi:hypothetical protein
MEEAATAGGFFKVPMLWGHARSGHTITYAYENIKEMPAEQLLVPHTTRIFPAKLPRKMLHDRLAEIKTLRNRIAHHETLIKRNSQTDYANLLETIGWISPTIRRWVEHQSNFQVVYGRPLAKRPKSLTAGE